MTNQVTINQMREMKFSAMANEFEDLIQNPGKVKGLSTEEYVGLLVNAEWNKRRTNKMNRLIKKAGFSVSNADIRDIEYYDDRKLDRNTINNYATCQYITENHNIILKGATGSGKTYIACALGKAACQKYLSVAYTRLPNLINELRFAEDTKDLGKILKAYEKVDLLILDEWLSRAYEKRDIYNVFEIIDARANSEHGSMIFCTQYDNNEWYERLNPDNVQDSPISDAIMDRIVHNSYNMKIEGQVSMRERHGLSAEERNTTK